MEILKFSIPYLDRLSVFNLKRMLKSYGLMKQKPLHVFAVREATLLVASSMFLGLFISLTAQGLLSEKVDNAFLNRLVILFGELAILIPPIVILKQRQIHLEYSIPLKPVSFVTVGMAVVLVLGAIGMTSIFEIIVLPYFPIPEYLKQLESDLLQGNMMNNLVLIIAAGFAAPIVEEIIFRGILQQSLFYRYGSLIPVLIIPTVIFALFHVAYLFYPPALIELLALALILSWLTIKTGNLLIPILIHGLFNLSSFTEVFVSNLEETTTLSDLGIPWIIISSLMFITAWFYFRHMPIAVIDEVYLIPPVQMVND